MPRLAAQRDLLGRPLRKPPPAPEFALQCLVADILRRWIKPGWRFTHIASGEYRSKATAGRLKRMGVIPGWPDLILLSPAALAHFLELKRRGEKLSEDQDEFAEYALAHGYPFEWTDNFDKALAILKGWGALRTEVRA
jgi:hypothetical protein